MVVEVMGRHAGWIAWYAGVAGGADYILVPEKPFTLQEVCDSIKKRHERGKTFSIIVVSEGAKLVEGGSEKEILQTNKLDSFGHVRLGGIANILAEEIEKETGFETRATILGHIQRGGTPTAFDRVLGTRLGVFAAELVNNGQWGMMAALRGTKIIAAPLAEAVGQLKTLDLDLMDVASTFFG
jgi:6-phosphofructokinase 1